MKTKPFLLIASMLLSGFSQSNATNSSMLLTKDKDINVALNNVCQYYAQIVVCNGNDSAGINPSVGILKCSWPQGYMHYDSLSLDSVLFLQIADNFSTPWGTKSMFLGNQNTILSYNLTYGNYYCDTIFISPKDTLQTDSVAGMKLTDSEQLAVIRKTNLTPNFTFYDTGFAINFSLQLNMIPIFVSLPSYSNIAGVIGVNQNNETVLNVIDLTQQQVVLDTILGPDAANPFALNFKSQLQLFLVSCPGDSVTNVFKFNYQSGVWIQSTVYAGSGIHVSTWEQTNIHFQPENDTSVNALDRQVIVYNCNTMTPLGTFNIDKRLSVLSYPVNSDGYFYNIYAVSDSVSDIVYAFDAMNYNFVDSFVTDLNPSLFLGDWRCPVKVDEYDDSKVEWHVYPNPSMTDFKISASGLICGRDYKMDIIDMEGKILYESTVHAKMTITLPTAHFESGIYFVRIHTLKGFITQEIIKQ